MGNAISNISDSHAWHLLCAAAGGMAPQLEMLHRQLEPNMLIFNAAMSASEKGEQRQQAPGMLSEMRKGRWSLMF